MAKGKIVAAALAPHPPHLVYAANPPQNEPRAECGWENLRWAYDRLAENLKKIDFDTIVIMSPHWRTYVGNHILACDHYKSISVDPIFPHLFRFQYDMKGDVALAKEIFSEASAAGLNTKLMQNPDFRVDYGTIVSCHLARPTWDKPIVSISTQSLSAYYNVDVMQEKMIEWGQATKRAIEKSGKKVLILASNSLSHRHFTKEPPIPEDMSHEHIYHHGQYLWDMKMIDLMKKGQSKKIIELMPDFTEQAVSETDSGTLTWMLSALDFPDTPAIVHGYGTVIGTGNAVVEWPLNTAVLEAVERPLSAAGMKTTAATSSASEGGL